jgi:hypothetical protein
MKLFITFFVLAVVASTSADAKDFALPVSARDEVISRAQVWRPVDVGRQNTYQGPDNGLGIQIGATIECTFVPFPKDTNGKTPKFKCQLPAGPDGKPGKEIKVKYGKDNGEIYALPVATRLFWALGFPADTTTPVARVICHGCTSEDPWADFQNPQRLTENRDDRKKSYTFDYAIIQKAIKGDEIYRPGQQVDSGWSWDELSKIDASKGGSTLAQIDALKLLSSFIAHVDSKAEQQVLVCLPNKAQVQGQCLSPLMYAHDLGATFAGLRRIVLIKAPKKIDFNSWSNYRLWKDEAHCVADIAASGMKGDGGRGGLNHPIISEEGRVFLANLMRQLDRDQIIDMFAVAGVDRKDSKHSAEQWADLFIEKMNREIINRAPCQPLPQQAQR